jgi:hypothetical protein
VCARCGGVVQAPDLLSSSWLCDHDGEVDPFHVIAPPGVESLPRLAKRVALPLWVLDPMPVGWTLGGVAHAGDDRTGARATVTGWCGPSPAGGVADLLLVAEEPGVGVGARYAGRRGIDAGECATGQPYAHVRVHGRPVALWHCAETPEDRVALVGEADGWWLWAVLWPALADLLLLEKLSLRDARHEVCRPQVGAACLRLTA